MMESELVFEREKETKNTVRYQEKTQAGKPPVIGSLYVQKWFCGDAPVLIVKIEKESA